MKPIACQILLGNKPQQLTICHHGHRIIRLSIDCHRQSDGHGDTLSMFDQRLENI